MKHSLQIVTTLILITPFSTIYAGEKPSVDLTDSTRTVLNQEYVEGIEEYRRSMQVDIKEESGRFMETPALYKNYDIISNEQMRQDAILAGLESPYPSECVDLDLPIPESKK